MTTKLFQSPSFDDKDAQNAIKMLSSTCIKINAVAGTTGSMDDFVSLQLQASNQICAGLAILLQRSLDK